MVIVRIPKIIINNERFFDISHEFDLNILEIIKNLKDISL